MAGVEPAELCVDAVDALGTVTVDAGALGWLTTGDAAASVIVVGGDAVE